MTSNTLATERRQMVEAVVERARSRWPGIDCGPNELEEHVERVGSAGDLARFGEELYLACACCRSDTSALRILDREYVRKSSGTLARLRAGPDFAEEALQQLRHKLLLPPEPRLAQYAATGPLLAWTRMVLLRLALDMRRSNPLSPENDLAYALAEQAPVDIIDADRYRGAISVAIRQVFLELRPEDRNLLRLHHLEGLSLDQLATMHGVHRATIARWLAELRQRVFEKTQREVGAAHRLTKSEFRSVFRRIQSSLDAFGILLETAEPTR